MKYYYICQIIDRTKNKQILNHNLYKKTAKLTLISIVNSNRIITVLMKVKNLLMSVMLMCVASMFTTSCVQGDWFDDIYENSDEWLLPRIKRGKEYNPQIESIGNKLFADNWANIHDFASNESECLACALYNYSVAKSLNNTRYQMRQYVGRIRYGEDWQYPYYLSVTQGNGVLLSDDQVESIISASVSASNHTSSKEDLKPKFLVEFKNYDNDVIIELDSIHYGVLQRVWKDNEHCIWLIYIKDQNGDGQSHNFNEITGVWY